MKYVPLPEVREHTDVIEIGQLGLPVGFDLEQLELNVPRVEKICKLAGISNLGIVGYRGDTTEYSYGVGGIDSGGIASATQGMSVSKAKISKAVTNTDDTNLGRPYRWSDATVKINNPEIEERIKADGDKWNRGVFDANGRAKYMNSALQIGIMEVATDSTFQGSPAVARSIVSAGAFAVNVALVDMLNGVIGAPNLPIYVVAGIVIGVDNVMNEVHHQVTERYSTADLPKYKYSIMPKMPYDRYVGAVILAANSKLIRAK